MYAYVRKLIRASQKKIFCVVEKKKFCVVEKKKFCVVEKKKICVVEKKKFCVVEKKKICVVEKKKIALLKKKNLRWIITDCMQHRTCLKHWYIMVSPRGHLFYVDFLFLFLLLTAVGMLPPRWEHSHRGENILTTAEVETFPPRWEHSHRGENIPTAVRSISTAVGSHVICDDTFARHHLVPTCDTIHPIIETAWNTVKYTRLEYGYLP